MAFKSESSSNKFAEIDKLMQTVDNVLQGKKKDAIVALCEQVIKLLHVVGLALFDVTIHALNVGVHFDNRYGLGVKARLMQILGHQIFRSGFRWSACTDAICVEEDDKGNIGRFTLSLQSRSSKLGRQQKRTYITVVLLAAT